jgi:hypothetical protein
MRMVLANKGGAANVCIGMSENTKTYERTVFCIEEEGKIYKVLSIGASKQDGSLMLFLNYCREKRGFVFQCKFRNKPGFQQIKADAIEREYEVFFDINSRTKLSLHATGFVQLSGDGVLSGIDEQTGKARGIGVFSSPLATPVSSGPTVGFVCWGLAEGYGQLGKRKKGVQYIILKSSDFIDRRLPSDQTPNAYVLEIFILPEQANEYVYEHKGTPYIHHTLSTITYGTQTFVQQVADLAHFRGVVCVFPQRQWVNHTPEHTTGFMTGSPGGSLSKDEVIKAGHVFHLICPGDKSMSLLGEHGVGTLKR